MSAPTICFRGKVYPRVVRRFDTSSLLVSDVVLCRLQEIDGCDIVLSLPGAVGTAPCFGVHCEALSPMKEGICQFTYVGDVPEFLATLRAQSTVLILGKSEVVADVTDFQEIVDD